MIKSRGQNHHKVVIVGGFAPVRLPQLKEMGIPVDPIVSLFTMAGKTSMRFSVPTIGPAVLGSYLQQHGIDLEIRDFFFDETGALDADIIGISSTFMGIEDVARVSDIIKQQNPTSTIVLGGPLSWSLPFQELLVAAPAVDYVVSQEGEQTFLDLIVALREKSDLSDVRGLAYRSGQGIIETGHRSPLASELIPEPAWELAGIPSAKRLPVLPVETSRGCPYHCAYCSETTYWSKPVRYRPIANVVDELRHNARQFGITTFRFTDSCFSSPPARSAELCNAIYDGCIREGIPIKWSAYSRIDNLSPELLDTMKRSGCVALDIGLESGSTQLLRNMGRKYSPEAAVEVARWARNAGIITNFNVVVGFPGETQETIKETADLIDRAAPDTFACFVFFLAPNTTVDAGRTNYLAEGRGLYWKHQSMTSEDAMAGIATIVENVSSSVSFPGGEYCSCYLASTGYSEAEIKVFFRAVLRIANSPSDEKASSVVKEVIGRVQDFW